MTKRILVAYSASSTHVQTTHDYLMSFRRHSRFEVDYVHVTHDAIMDFDFAAYDAIFHNYCARFCFEGYVSQNYLDKLKAFKGLKLLSIQDEYDFTDNARKGMLEYGFHVVLTCVPQDGLEYVYPKRMFPNTEFVTVLTGYLPADATHRQRAVRPLSERPFTIGYRGRDIGGRYGQLAHDKFEIGRKMKEILIDRGIAQDIDWTEESRIYGEAWFEFLGSLRATLGTESGSNVFDFDGAIAARAETMTKELGRPPSYEEFAPFTRELERKISMGQISPRVFEAALTRTPLVLYSGRYSDAIQAGEHYVELKPDFSNINDVIAQLRDIPHMQRIADNAYDHLVASGRFSYTTFVELVEGVIERKVAALKTAAAEDVPIDWRRRTAADPLDIAEFPTPEPKPRIIFRARQYKRDYDVYLAEVRRLQTVYPAEIARLNREYPERIKRLEDEIARLSKVYPAEIKRLSTNYQLGQEESRVSYTTEIDRLNYVLTTEVTRLNDVFTGEIARLNDVYVREIARLNEVYTEEIARLNRVYPAEIARLHRNYGVPPADQDVRVEPLVQSEYEQRNAAQLAEMARLHASYTGQLTTARELHAKETVKLRRTLQTQIDRLNAVIAEKRPMQRWINRVVLTLRLPPPLLPGETLLARLRRARMAAPVKRIILAVPGARGALNMWRARRQRASH